MVEMFFLAMWLGAAALLGCCITVFICCFFPFWLEHTIKGWWRRRRAKPRRTDYTDANIEALARYYIRLYNRRPDTQAVFPLDHIPREQVENGKRNFFDLMGEHTKENPQAGTTCEGADD